MELQNGTGLPTKHPQHNTSKLQVIAVVPAHNERRFIGSVVIEALQYVNTVIVVDDGSSDGTARIAKEAGAIVLRHETNLGKAKAIEYGFAAALELSPTAIVMLDGDGQHSPDEIPGIVAPIIQDEADMVIGSRFQGTEVQVPRWRQFGQHALTLITNYTSGTKSTDSQSGFRAFSPQILKNFTTRTSGFSIESEMQFWATEYGINVAEIPINCVYEEKSKRNPIAHGLQVLNGIFQLVSESRPLFYFGVIGALIMLVGIVGWWWTLSQYAKTDQFAFGYGLVSALTTIIGIIFIFQGITLNTLRKVMEQQSPRLALKSSDSGHSDHTSPVIAAKKNGAAEDIVHRKNGFPTYVEMPGKNFSSSAQHIHRNGTTPHTDEHTESTHSAGQQQDESHEATEKGFDAKPFRPERLEVAS